MKRITILLFVLALGVSVQAEDFSVNHKGKTIYYKITSSVEPLTVAVTFRGTSYYHYSNEYSGDVEIPESVTTYSDNTYSVTSIEDHAFRGCNELTSITIPNSVTSIGEYAFTDCTGLITVNFNATNCKMAYRVFRDCTTLTTLNIGANVKTIPNHAFLGCSSITSLVIPNSVTYIGNSAFGGCTGLTSIDFNATNCTMGGYLSLNGYTGSAFEGCTAITTLNIGSNVTVIPEYAFIGCNGLKAITIPNSVEYIGGSAFFGCDSLVTVNFNATNCTTMNRKNASVFSSSARTLTTLNIGENVKTIPSHAFTGCSSITSLVIPNSVTYIGEGAFGGCDGLVSLIISDSVTTIERNTFASCDGLVSLTIGKSVTSIGEAAFANCIKLTTLTIPNSVISIRENAFIDCRKLTSLTIGNSVTSIGEAAFGSCYELTTVTIGSSVTDIASNAFMRCSNITTVNFNATNCTLINHFFGYSLITLNLGTNVKTIPDSMFSNWSKLTSVTIPNSVTYIGDDAFYNCTDLQEVTVNWETPLSVPTNTFRNVNTQNVRLQIPDGTYELYKSAEVWKDFILEDFSKIATINDIPLVIYPNPVTDELRIDTDSKINSVQVIDLTGKMVYSSLVNNHSINLSALPTGVYLVRINTDKGVGIERIIKELQ